MAAGSSHYGCARGREGRLLAAYILVLVSAVAAVALAIWSINAAEPRNDHVSVIAANIRWSSWDDLGATRSGDFDGDGTEDSLDVDYNENGGNDRGLVYVRSGSSDAILLKLPVDCPIDSAKWAGDMDGNGTCDVAVRSNGQCRILGHDGVPFFR